MASGKKYHLERFGIRILSRALELPKHISEISTMVFEPQCVSVGILGGYATGKSSLVKRLSGGKFELQCQPTMGVKLLAENVKTIDNKTLRFRVLDMAGNPCFRGVVHMYLRRLDAAVLVYDTTDRRSFDVLKTLASEIRKYNFGDPLLIVVGTKCDGR